mmetsp:Transcript_8717/g.25868  ORF Transcript_8717/g.25868 Transcript_8717/m.25868 type:complete len:260 (-) Transcript_8717:32-811(-)
MTGVLEGFGLVGEESLLSSDGFDSNGSLSLVASPSLPSGNGSAATVSSSFSMDASTAETRASSSDNCATESRNCRFAEMRVVREACLVGTGVGTVSSSSSSPLSLSLSPSLSPSPSPFSFSSSGFGSFSLDSATSVPEEDLCEGVVGRDVKVARSSGVWEVLRVMETDEGDAITVAVAVDSDFRPEKGGDPGNVGRGGSAAEGCPLVPSSPASAELSSPSALRRRRAINLASWGSMVAFVSFCGCGCGCDVLWLCCVVM